MEQILCWDVTPEGARTTEGWVKHDLEAGNTATMWLRNAASDALADSTHYGVTPLAYMEEILDNVEASPQVIRRALLEALLTAVREELTR